MNREPLENELENLEKEGHCIVCERALKKHTDRQLLLCHRAIDVSMEDDLR